MDLSQDTAPNQIYRQIKDWNIDIDILVNNAGIGMTGLFVNQNSDRLATMIKINNIACMKLAHLFVRDFVKKGK